GRVHAHFSRAEFHNPLDVEGSFRTARSAIGVSGHLVGKDADDVDLYGWNLVAAGVHERGELRNQWREQLMIGAHICEYTSAQAENRAVLLKGKLHVVERVAAVDRRHKIFPAAFVPFHGASGFHRQPGNDAFYTVYVQLPVDSTV